MTKHTKWFIAAAVIYGGLTLGMCAWPFVQLLF